MWKWNGKSIIIITSIIYILFAGAIPLSEIQTVFESEVRFVCPEGQIFATGVREINTRCMPGGQWSTAYIPKCQEVRRKWWCCQHNNGNSLLGL